MTDHGGRVIDSIPHTDLNGKAMAGKGNMVLCPKCKGAFPIIEGSFTYRVNGVPVAFDGMKTACGASLIASASHGAPYSESDQYINAALNEGGKVIAYFPCKSHSSIYKPTLDSSLISVIDNPENDTRDNGIAKIGGIPSWLQDEENTTLEFILQINNSRLNKSAPKHKGILVGGMGYLFLKREITNQDQEAGSFIIQTT